MNKYELCIHVRDGCQDTRKSLLLEWHGQDDDHDPNYCHGSELPLQPTFRNKKSYMIENGQSIITNKLLEPFSVETDKVRSLQLRLSDTIKHCPPEIYNLEYMQALKICHSHGLTHLQQPNGGIENLKNLRVLEISNCDRLESLPSEIKYLENLEELQVRNCPCLLQPFSLPLEEVGSFKRLHTLGISWSSTIWGDFLSSILEQNPAGLEVLSIDSSCDLKEKFPFETLRNLKKSVRTLEISDISNRWRNLTNDFLPKNTTTTTMNTTFFENLQEIKINDCNGLVHLPAEVVRNLKCLRKLTIERCNKLKDLPKEIGCLEEQLEEMTIIDCDRLLYLPAEIGNLKRLRKMKITTQSYSSLHSIPSLQVGNLKNLQELDIHYCGCLERLSFVINKLLLEERQKEPLQQFNIKYKGRGRTHKDRYATASSRDAMFDVDFTLTKEELTFHGFKTGGGLNMFLQSISAEPSSSLSPIASSLSSFPMSMLLPRNIQRINFNFPTMPRDEIDPELICKLLRKYPRLCRIHFYSNNNNNNNKEKNLDYFTVDLLHMMYFKRFGGAMQIESSIYNNNKRNNDNDNDSLPWAELWTEKMLSIILIESKRRIENDLRRKGEEEEEKEEKNNKGRFIYYDTRQIHASVIYSLLRDPALPILLNISNNNNNNNKQTTTTTILIEPPMKGGKKRRITL